MKSERGGAAIEFAIVFPLLVTLLLGIIEFSLILYDKAIITNASREGARAGIVAQLVRVTNAEIGAVVEKYSKDHLISFGGDIVPTVSITPVDRSGSKFGDELTVTVTYPYGFLALPNFVTGMIGPMELSATTVMRME